jgi:hypothetical protein
MSDQKHIALAAKRLEIARRALAAAGVELPPLPQEYTTILAPVTAAPAAPVTPPSTAQTEDGEQSAVTFTSIVAEGAAVNNKTDAAASKPVAKPSLTDEERLDIMYKRDEALAETKERLLADVGAYILQAKNRQFDRFECRIDLRKPTLPISLQFSKIEANGTKEKQVERLNFSLDKYDESFKKRGIPMTLDDAVDLKIAVQSKILNTDGIEAAPKSKGGDGARYSLDTVMPYPVTDFSVVERSGGGYSLEVHGKNQSSREKEIIKPSIPLGIASINKDASEESERTARIDYVLDMLNKVGGEKAASGGHVRLYRGDVILKLQNWVEGQEKEWLTTESTVLPGFEKNQLIYVSPTNNQKITLGPVSLKLDPGGDNPSWHANLNFYIGDKTKPYMGEMVRTRVLNLHTRNPDLAIARTFESLLGVNNEQGKMLAEGFLPKLQAHMKETGAQWSVRDKDTKQEEVYVGEQPLQHFLDDMMRYEHDIGIQNQRRIQDGDGKVMVTLQALRSLSSDLQGSVMPNPELVRESKNERRRPIAYTLPVPENRIGEIDTFVSAVHDHMRRHAVEAYDSIAISEDGAPEQRKRPLEYRTSQIRNGLIRAIGKNYEKCFDTPPPAKWEEIKFQEALIQSAAHHSESRGETAHHHKRFKQPLQEGESFVHRTRRRPNPNKEIF